MLLCLYNRSSQVKLFKTDEADEGFNVTENKTNTPSQTFLPEILLRFGATVIVFLGNFYL